MLNTSGGNLCKYCDASNTMLKLQLGVIRALFQKSVLNIKHWKNTSLYSIMNDFVSRHCMQHVVTELEIVKRVGADKVACGYFIRTTHGLPCAHELANIKIQGYLIPLKSIHLF